MWETRQSVSSGGGASAQRAIFRIGPQPYTAFSGVNPMDSNVRQSR